MKHTTVKNTIVDPEKNITYEIIAYRQLSREEMVRFVRSFKSENGKKKIKKGSKITILSLNGSDE